MTVLVSSTRSLTKTGLITPNEVLDDEAVVVIERDRFLDMGAATTLPTRPVLVDGWWCCSSKCSTDNGFGGGGGGEGRFMFGRLN